LINKRNLLIAQSAALGSCRHKLENPDSRDPEYKSILGILYKYGISTFIYIGGNDSMDTVAKLNHYCERNRIEDFRIIDARSKEKNGLFLLLFPFCFLFTRGQISYTILENTARVNHPICKALVKKRLTELRLCRSPKESTMKEKQKT